MREKVATRLRGWKFAMRNALGSNPQVLSAWFGIRPNRSHLLCTPHTDLVIEGFPRSGNTSLVVALGVHNPSLRLAHHTHLLGNIRLALSHGVPVVVLVRNPVDSIASLMIREKVSASDALRVNIAYHSALIRVKSELLVLPFETVAGDLPKTVAAIGAFVGRSLEPRTADAIQAQKIRDGVISANVWSSKNSAIDPLRVSLPSESRMAALTAAKSLLASEHPARLRHATELVERLQNPSRG